MKQAKQLVFSLMVLLAGAGAAQAQANPSPNPVQISPAQPLTELSGLDHFAVNVTEMDRSVRRNGTNASLASQC